MEMSKVQRVLPAISGGSLCCLLTAYLAHSIRSATGGMFVYPLDDSYIHLALARTFAFDHVWGIGPYGFASASSSPGWTLILAFTDLVIGEHLANPIFVNLLLVFLILFAVDATIGRLAPRAPQWLRYVAPVFIVIGTPLPSLTLLGMEHVAQALSILLLITLAVEVVAVDPSFPVPSMAAYALLGSALFAGAIRYEAVFALFPVLVLMGLRRRFRLAVLLAACASVGPVAFALLSYPRSGFLLPFSVLVKLSQHATQGVPLRVMVSIFLGKRENTPFVALLLVIWTVRIFRRSFWEPLQLLLFLTVVLTCEHLAFAPVGWLMRYESYIVCLILTVLTVAIGQVAWGVPSKATLSWSRGRYALVAAGAVLAVMSMVSESKRIVSGNTVSVQAAVDRYDEHIQMARFLGGAYDHQTVVLDDIGAVAYYSHAHILDMIGLGSIEPLLPARKGRSFTADDMNVWAKSQGASIAILQEGSEKVRGWTPPSWTLVQVWQQPRNIVFHDLTTSIYAVNSDEVLMLCRKLSEFSVTKDDRVIFSACPV